MSGPSPDAHAGTGSRCEAAAHVQPSLLEGTPLHEVPFVVVDLETTGGSPHADAITEIGAVRVQGGEVTAELGTLVNPERGIPAQITVLTGITNAMVMDAPTIETVLPSFLELAHGAVLVAHNARFDIGFLRAAAERIGMTWPNPRVVDTVALARRVVTKDEAPNHKLASLARLFHSATQPNHRALSDARATVDVLHGLLARMAPLGVTHLEDLATAADPVPEARRRKATLAQDLPSTSGVYQFRDASGRVLYIGTATNLRSRVRSYFTASEKRKRMAEMLTIAASVHPIPCPTPVEAAVREIRLLAEHRPPYNQRSTRPHAQPWLRLTREPYPRLSIARTPPPLGEPGVLGPFPSRVSAQLALECASRVFGLRTCTARLPATPEPRAVACTLAELGHCSAVCTRAEGATAYAHGLERYLAFARGERSDLLDSVTDRLRELSAAERFEQAALERDRLQSLLRGAEAVQDLTSGYAPEIVAARPRAEGSWEVVVTRFGRLTASGIALRTRDVPATARALQASAQDVPEPTSWCESALAEETRVLTAWLTEPRVRLLSVQGAGPHLPVFAARRARAELTTLLQGPARAIPGAA
ncbi:DEDD exonuclease domain-containing protein [Serinibacter salmoneus]|uniref:DNA polymerase-3 subunit epsilon n=1 Tax=Serinibacter salmoneus TaxID=556530 RepID=A0A2A9CYN8_9MICO|nr:DEDD exonuclease domain-containing protein [Serinibacter salmoneus]PFG19513.1 DNA polymerase-3 subunit epsilon [Serinibacter salmoneus]